MNISVIGAGYVGLITATCFASWGHHVSLIDIDICKINSINKSEPPIYEKGLDDLLRKTVGKTLIATTDYDAIKKTDIIFICVGTPADNSGNTDLSGILNVSRQIGVSIRALPSIPIIVVKSTVPPGTTENIIAPAIRLASGIENIDVAMNPEFLREGIAIDDFLHPDRIVIGAENTVAVELLKNAYVGIDAPIVVTGISAAEMIKYASNAFLATKISYANEIGNLCKKLGIDVRDVMKAVGMDHRISPFFLNAGVGFGGSCFPKDLQALVHLYKKNDEESNLLDAVIRVNDLQPQKMIGLLKKRVGSLKGKNIAVLGLAFKDNTDDIRESRSIPIIKSLIQDGANVYAYDPVAMYNMGKIFPDIAYCTTSAQALHNADACLIMTEWPQFKLLDKEFDTMKTQVIIAGRDILSVNRGEGICW